MQGACYEQNHSFPNYAANSDWPGSLSQTAAEVRRLNAKRVLIVTDKGLIAAGISSRVKSELTAADIPWIRFAEVEPDPPFEIAMRAAEIAKKEKVDLVIGLGGGSSIDIAKVCAVLATNTKSVTGLFGIETIPISGLTTIMIPTTAGTGCEATPIAILSGEQEKLKKGIVSSRLFPAVAILDLGVPRKLVRSCG